MRGGTRKHGWPFSVARRVRGFVSSFSCPVSLALRTDPNASLCVSNVPCEHASSLGWSGIPPPHCLKDFAHVRLVLFRCHLPTPTTLCPITDIVTRSPCRWTCIKIVVQPHRPAPEGVNPLDMGTFHRRTLRLSYHAGRGHAPSRDNPRSLSRAIRDSAIRAPRFCLGHPACGAIPGLRHTIHVQRTCPG